ncbi:MAG TPA: IPT/TIG domain-containing protein [Acidimicrobiales bacterium]
MTSKMILRRVLLFGVLMGSGVGSAVLASASPAGAVSAPTVSGISPSIGSAAGGTNVTITGTGFEVGPYETLVRFAPGGEAESVYCASTTSCVVQTPPGTGTSDITVYVGGQPDAQTTVFTYGPSLGGASPASGPILGGTSVLLSGTGFSTAPGGTVVDFGATPSPSVTCQSSSYCTAVSPAGGPGTVAITASVQGIASPASDGIDFTYGGQSSAGSHGYWLVGSDGGIFTFGGAPFEGSLGATPLQRPVVGITPSPDRLGYLLVASDGGAFSFGDTSFFGSLPLDGFTPAGTTGHALAAPIVGIVPTADNKGYFMVGSDGGVFSFGDAKFEGSCPGIGGCSGAAVAVMPDATGNGYWVITKTGHVYTFGDANYFGAPGPQVFPVTSAVRTPDGNGYWILFSNGSVNGYGDAANLGGATGSATIANPANAIVATSDGAGYWVVLANGAVLPFGDAPNLGGASGTHLNGSIIAAAGS